MATYTSKLNLKKPEGNELFNRVQDLNDNWDKIDAHAHGDAYYTEAEVDSLLITKVDKETGKSLVSDATLLDLTDGNETTLHKHNASNTPFTPTGNLSSMNVQNALAELDSEKASKTQEAWITPTLLNGWVNNSGVISRFKRDAMGVVWCELFINGGNTSSIIFNLPIGYRPSQSLFITGNASGVVSQIIILPGGDVVHSVGANTSLHRYVFNFRTN